MCHLVQGVPDDFDVHLVQVLLRYTVLEEGGCRKKEHISQNQMKLTALSALAPSSGQNGALQRSSALIETLSPAPACVRLTERRVHQDGVVELGGRLGDVHRLHLLEAAQRVALGHQLGDGPLVQRARDQQDHVVNHVAVPAERRRRSLNTTRHQPSLDSQTP